MGVGHDGVLDKHLGDVAQGHRSNELLNVVHARHLSQHAEVAVEQMSDVKLARPAKVWSAICCARSAKFVVNSCVRVCVCVMQAFQECIRPNLFQHSRPSKGPRSPAAEC